MKKYIYSSLVLLLAACSSGDSLEAKKSKLAEITAQIEELNTQAGELEKEIALLDTAAIIRKPKLVQVTSLNKGAFSHFIDIQGMVESDDNISVQPGMPGVVTNVFVREGDQVSVGQILAEVDNRTIRESIAQLETNLEFAKTNFEKQERLWNQKIGSEIQYLQAKTQYESLGKNLSTLRAQLDMTRMKAPIAGTVDQVNVKIGEYAAPGPMGAFNVVNFNRMKVTARVADSYIKNIHTGDPVRIVLSDINETIEGKINFVSKVVNSMSRTFLVEVAIGKTESSVRPNMLATLSINDANLADVVQLPTNLVQKDANNNKYVMIAEKGKDGLIARKKAVETGIYYGDKIVITEGLTGSEQLITSGYQEVVDGQTITLN